MIRFGSGRRYRLVSGQDVEWWYAGEYGYETGKSAIWRLVDGEVVEEPALPSVGVIEE